MTNFERLQDMSMEEMAEFLAFTGCDDCFSDDKSCGIIPNCVEGKIGWLEREVE